MANLEGGEALTVADGKETWVFHSTLAHATHTPENTHPHVLFSLIFDLHLFSFIMLSLSATCTLAHS